MKQKLHSHIILISEPACSIKRILFFGLLAFCVTACQHNGAELLPSGLPDNGGLLLPDGFEALVVADNIGPARHMVVNSNGDIYVKLKSASPEGGIVALRDTTNDGKADIIQKFGVDNTRGNYETGMEIHDGYLYYSTHLYVFRYPLIPGELIPDTTRKDTIIIDDHAHGSHEHIGKPLSFDNDGNIYTAFGAPSDACQEQNRIPGSPGMDPCPILENHAGIWRFHADSLYQVQQESHYETHLYLSLAPSGERYATGLRSIVAMDWNPVDNELYVVQHGRDNLHSMWPGLFTPWDNAVLPAEEFARVTEGSDFGWPYCFYDQFQEKKVLAPEYGGDGGETGRCSEFENPIVGFPGHFAPNDLKFYRGNQFPEYYKNGAFIAFHGSTIRNPYPQAGYFVGFVPFNKDGFTKEWEVFANGFSVVDTVKNTNESQYRPMGLAEGPHGTLYISDSVQGKIWKILFKGDKRNFGEQQLARMKKEKISAINIRYPDITEDNLHKNAPVAGETVYRLYCAACHQTNGEGVAGRFPPVKGSAKITGSAEELLTIILNGQDTPDYEIAMPPHYFLSDEEAAEVTSYIRRHFGGESGMVSPGMAKKVRNSLRVKTE